MNRQRVFVTALLVDTVFGEPPTWLHPVVWMGQVIRVAESRAPRSPGGQLLYGGVLAVALPALAALIGWRLERTCARWPVVGDLLAGLVLSTTFAVRELARAAGTVEAALVRGDLAAARAALPALVSRDPSDLKADQVAAAAIESVAENLGDSVLGPWLAYAAAGLPGALAYRAVNTLDSMIGYRGHYEWLGKASARLDDLANWLPARLAAGLIALAGRQPGRAWAVARAEHQRTASPNAGWPMSAMAGALDVSLEKVGHYRLHPTGRTPSAKALHAAIARYRRAVVLAALLILAIGAFRR